MEIIRHLGTKIDESMLEYRPTEKQRSTLELMNYLGHAFATGVTADIAGDTAMFGKLAAEAPVVTLSNFDLVMQMQCKDVVEKLEALTEDDLAKEVEIFGNKDTLAGHLFGVSKWAAAYKMQLFLYIKACGKHELNTMNLWRGVDPAPKE